MLTVFTATVHFYNGLCSLLFVIALFTLVKSGNVISYIKLFPCWKRHCPPECKLLHVHINDIPWWKHMKSATQIIAGHTLYII